MKLLHAAFLLFYTFITESLLLENKKENHALLVNKSRNFPPALTKDLKGFFRQRRQFSTHKATKDKIPVPFRNRIKKEGVNLSKLISKKHGLGYRRSKQRSQKRNRRKYSKETDKSSSTSFEMAQWKKEFDEDWVRLKKQTLLQRQNSTWFGDEVSMIAARPWATPCGDPIQHDWPWGTCMLPQQCEAEYRIYRGDLLCGRSSLVCCSVQLTQHDMYQGLDLSFARTSSSSSDEKSKNEITSRQRRRDKRHRLKIRRYKNVRRQKKLIKRKIRSLVHQIRKTLNRAYRNTTRFHKLKVDELKVTIQKLKRHFREQRKIAKFRFEISVEEFKKDLYLKLVSLNKMNMHFLINETFRAFLKKHNIDGMSLRALQLEYPSLADYITGGEKLSEGLQQILDLAMLNETQVALVEASLKSTKPPQIAVDLLKEIKPIQLATASHKATKPTRLAVDLNKEIKLSQSAETEPTELPVNYYKKFKKKELRTLDVSPIDGKTYVTEGSPLVQGSTIVDEMYANMDTYVAMEPEAVQEKTRRSGRGIFVKGKDHPKILKDQDYLEYDIEYGLLYI